MSACSENDPYFTTPKLARCDPSQTFGNCLQGVTCHRHSIASSLGQRAANKMWLPHVKMGWDECSAETAQRQRHAHPSKCWCALVDMQQRSQDCMPEGPQGPMPPALHATLTALSAAQQPKYHMQETVDHQAHALETVNNHTAHPLHGSVGTTASRPRKHLLQSCRTRSSVVKLTSVCCPACVDALKTHAPVARPQRPSPQRALKWISAATPGSASLHPVTLTAGAGQVSTCVAANPVTQLP
jgi:hypothetical protein